jgi:outer membrane protein TolC
VQITKRQWADAFRTLAASLRSQYMVLIYQKMALRNARFTLQISETDLATQEELLKDGTISAGAINPVRLNVQQQRLAVDQAEQNFAHSRRLFAHTAGFDDLAEDSVPAEIPQLDPGPAVAKSDGLLKAFINGGAEETLTGQVYVMQIKQADMNYWIQRTRLYPKFSLSASYSVSNSQVAVGNTVSQSAYDSYSYGISGSWNIFDGFATRAAKISALASKHTTERQFKDYTESTTETAIDDQKQIGFAARSLDIAEQNLGLARDGYNRAVAELKEGTAAKVAVDAVQVGFYATEYAANVARANYLRAWSDFVSLVGADPVLNKVPGSYVNPRHGK